MSGNESSIEYEDVYYMGNSRETATEAVDALVRKEAQVESALDRAEQLRAEKLRDTNAGATAVWRVIERMTATLYDTGSDILQGRPISEILKPSRRFDLGLALTLFAGIYIVGSDLN